MFGWSNTKAALLEFQEVLRCKLCKNVTSDPVNYNMCGHFFCKTCIKSKKNNCPLCGVPSLPSEITSDRLITNLVMGLKKISETIGFDCTEMKITPKDNILTQVTEVNTNSGSSRSTKTSERRSSKRSSNKVADNKEEPSNEEKPKNTRKSRTKQPDVLECQKPVPITNTKKLTRTSISKEINKRNAKGETQLHVACIKGKAEQVKKFLDAGANPNTKDYAGWTPLLEAVNNGFIEIVELLLKHGAMVNAPGCENITPLHEAVSSGRVEVAKLLLSYGADTYARNINGITPKELACTDEMKAILKSTSAIPVIRPIVELKGLNNDPDNIAVLGCGLDKQQQKELTTLSQRLKLKVFQTFTADVTHIVVPTDSSNVCSTSKDVIQGILQGKWIVNSNWLSMSLEAGELIDPEPFEVKGTSRFPSSEAPRHGRINAEKQFPSILNGCHIFLSGLASGYMIDNCKLSKTDITYLVRSGDGVVLSREPDPESIPQIECTVPYHASRQSSLVKCSHYVIYKKGKDEPQLKYNMSHIKSLPLEWLLDCMECFTLKDPH